LRGSFAGTRCHGKDSAARSRASQTILASVLVALAALASAPGCGGGNARNDADARDDADADAGIDAAQIDGADDVPDVMTMADAGADGSGGDAAVAGDAAADATPADFVAIVPCLEPGAYVTGGAAIGTLGNAYSPACLRVRAGSSVSIEASVTHPLEPRPGGSASNPIPQQNSNATVVFATPGVYPFLCPEHVDQGMLGVVWVTP
jgi:plastocyanin